MAIRNNVIMILNAKLPTVHTEGVNFGESIMNMWNINVNILNSDITAMNFTAKSSSSSCKNSSFRSLRIQAKNCTLGRIYLEGIQNLIISNCNMTSSTSKQNTNLLKLLNSSGFLHYIRVKNLKLAGGISINSNSNILITTSQFHGNIIDNGVINVNDESSLTIKGSQFRQNRAQSSGGVPVIDTSQVFIENTLLSNNSGKCGGAIYMRNNAALQITNSILKFNRAKDSGSVIYIESKVLLQIDNSIFKNNVAYSKGGAICA